MRANAKIVEMNMYNYILDINGYQSKINKWYRYTTVCKFGVSNEKKIPFI